MPTTYTANFHLLNGFYDGLGLLALQGVTLPPHLVQSNGDCTGHSAGGGDLPPLNITFTNPVGAGNAILVLVVAKADPGNFLPDPSGWTITDTVGSTYTVVQAQADGIGGTNHANITFIAQNIAAGANTVELQWTHGGVANRANLAVLLIELGGVPSSGVVQQASQSIIGIGPDASLSITGTPSLLLMAYNADAVALAPPATSTFVDNFTQSYSQDNTTVGEAESITTWISNPILTCGSPPSGFTGVAYTATLPLVGGLAPFTFSISSGSLPTGLTLNTSTGVISGTPTAVGTFPFGVHVVDSSSDTSDTSCSITISAGLALDCNSPPPGEVGVAYSHTLDSSGGTPPYTFSISSGALPGGLSLNTTTGAITGTPTTPGTFPFGVHLVDSASNTADVSCSIVISSALSISCASPPAGMVGVSYSHTFPASGGLPPYTYFIASGSLPPGLTLDPSTGIVSGDPTMAGTFPFTIGVSDV